MTKNYHKIEQSAFYHLSGLRGTMDNAREALRDLYPVGTIIRTDRHFAVKFKVAKVSSDSYDLEELAALTVVDPKGHELVLQCFGEFAPTITVVSRPKPPPPPPVPEPAPWEPGEGWYLLPVGEPLKPGDGYVHPNNHAAGFIDYDCRPDCFRDKRGGSATAHKWQWRRRKQ